MSDNLMLDGALAIINKLNNCGYEAYIVGGYVRDYLLKRDCHDIDITTVASPDVVSRIFPNSFNKSEKFKTVTVRENSYEYEVTTFRKDSLYTDHRHPLTKTTSLLKEDVKRRDFTINALCLDKDLNLIDYVDGKDDLDNGIIKTVGRPIKRFKEDALRMFRAFRFASRLNFEIDYKTKRAIYLLYPLVKYISKERVKDELSKMVNEPYFDNYINKIIDSKILINYPEIEKALAILHTNYIKLDFLGLMTLSSFINGKIKSSLILSRKEIRDIEISIKYIDALLNRNINYNLIFDLEIEALDRAFDVLKVLKMDSIYLKEDIINFYNNLEIKNEKELDIDGDDIKKALKISNSPKIKEIKSFLVKSVIQGKVKNKKADLIKYINNYEK